MSHLSIFGCLSEAAKGDKKEALCMYLKVWQYLAAYFKTWLEIFL